MGKNKSLIYQVKERFDSLMQIGESRFFAKTTGQENELGITSFGTRKAYQKHCCSFVRWAKTNYQCKTLEECREHVEEWLLRDGVSSATRKTQRSALKKLYQEDLDVKLPKRKRSDIKRSRYAVEYDRHFSKSNNSDLITFASSTGLRRSELVAVRGVDIMTKNNELVCHVCRGKGGKERFAPIIGTTEEIRTVLDLAEKAADEKIFTKIHSAMDVHSYRGTYATKIYKKYAQPISIILKKNIDYTALTGKWGRNGERIYKNALYFCRDDRKNIVFDRRAMIMASQALGHNRESVVGAHYIRIEECDPEIVMM